MKKIHILLTGGGTGGHIYPLIAVAEELKHTARQHNLELHLKFLGAPSNFQTVLEGYGIDVSKTVSSKLRRYFSLLNLLEPFKFIIGFIQAIIKLYFIMPNVIFSKSGPGTVPIVLAAWFYRIPIIIHESDAIPGLANRIASIFATSIGVGFPSTAKSFAGKHVAVVGNPVRQELINNRDDDQILAKRFWGFNPNKPVIVVLGGSQGAEEINDFMIQNVPALLKKYQILHQTGQKNFNTVKDELKFISKDIINKEKKGYQITAYFNNQQLKEALLSADLVISRAGAGSIFEIASFGKPAILIPLEGHQRYNADEFASAGGGVVIGHKNLLASLFTVQVDKILGNPDTIASMRSASANFYIPHSAKILAEEIIKTALK